MPGPYPVCQVKLAHDRCHLKTRLLQGELHVDCFIRLQPDNEFIPKAVQNCFAARQSNGWLELNANLSLAFVQGLNARRNILLASKQQMMRLLHAVLDQVKQAPGRCCSDAGVNKGV